MRYTKVVIVGGGFAGLNAAQHLKNARDVEVILIDKTNHHCFQPLLYQVATAALSPGNIALPIREVLARQKNAEVIMADVLGVDLEKKVVNVDHGGIFRYDYLILAPGTRHSYFAHPEWEQNAPGLKTLEDAVKLREKILLSYERAERLDSVSEAAKFMTFVIVGGGPTGIEMAGAIAEMASKSLTHNFRKIKPEQSKIYLIESAPQLLPVYPKFLGDKAKSYLEKMGVKVLLGSRVIEVENSGVKVSRNGEETWIDSRNVIWAAGNQASPLLKSLNVPLDRAGRVLVKPDLSIENHPNVFVIGDAAALDDLPGIAPVAIQEGKYVAQLIKENIPPEKRQPFQYHDKGSLATIGKDKAVGLVWGKQMYGYPAWLAWCFIHIFYLISFPNRLLVMLQWFFWYLTNQRRVRLITNSIDKDKF